MDKQLFSQGAKTKEAGMLLQIIIGVDYLRWSAPRRLPNIKNAYGNQKNCQLVYMKSYSDDEFFKKRERKRNKVRKLKKHKKKKGKRKVRKEREI